MAVHNLLPAAAPSMSQALTTGDAAEVLRELLPAQNQSSSLGLALGLPPHQVEAIHSPNRPPQQCLREVIIKFLEQAPESRRNWRTITDALADPLVNHQALAETVKAAHFPDPLPIDPAPANDPSDTTGMLKLAWNLCSLFCVLSHTYRQYRHH